MTSNQQENRRSDVIRCEFCGEDYSVTYRRCPFCDDRAGVPMESRSRSSKKGGRRVAPTNKRGGGYGGAVRPVQVIGIALSIILIIAAIYIVYSVLAPLFGGGEGGGSSIGDPAVSVSQSDVSVPDVSTPDVSVPDVSAPDVSTPDVSVPDVSTPVVVPVVKATGVTLSASDVTAKANESFTLRATVTPSNTDDTVVWSSSDESVAKVDQKGMVTNVNTASSQKIATITVKVGDVSATCTVRCKGGSSGNAQPSGTTATQPAGNTQTGTAKTVNASGVFNTGNANIRSGPGTGYKAQDSTVLNAQVKVLEETADGWYKITYSGRGGAATTGYVIKSAVTLK